MALKIGVLSHLFLVRGPFTTLRQLSKISVDNCVKQLEQTLGQLV